MPMTVYPGSTLVAGSTASMSFRSRLSLFFVAIVIVPMVAVGVVVFKLISDNEAGKADARVAAAANVGVGLYRDALSRGRAAARDVVGDPDLTVALQRHDAAAVRRRAAALARRDRLALLVVSQNGRQVASLGDPKSVAIVTGTASGVQVEVSTLPPAALTAALHDAGADSAIRRGQAPLAGTIPGAAGRVFPTKGQVKLGSDTYRVASFTAKGTGGPLQVTALIDAHHERAAVARGRRLAAAILLAFLALACFLAMLVSRSLQGQIAKFLGAARRLGTGDFSTEVPVEGRDEFAQLGQEFNKMSRELEQRLEELRQERQRLEQSIRRSGDTFAAKLDRDALLELGLSTAMDAVKAHAGRASIRDDGRLVQRAAAGELGEHGEAIKAAERDALKQRRLVATHGADGAHAIAMPLVGDENRPARGLITVARTGEPFTPVERELFASLAGQAAVSIENVALHEQVQRQAVTDELTGLANHRRFQEVLAQELAGARRDGQTTGLVMLDVDNFKQVNDTHGHPQGDEVLRALARVLRETAREVDHPARYGGEEMAIVLHHTDLAGAYNAAERVRTAVERLEIPSLDGGGPLRVTASLGVAAAATGSGQDLIAAADKALYEAKAAGKNQTVRGIVEGAPA
jgi:diguanylate cyclase (GGDEF)-like protein